MLERRDPDVIALQEVDRTFDARSDFDDQIKLLAERLEMDYRFGANLIREATAESGGSLRRYGIATLYSCDYPLVDAQHYLLPKIDYEERFSERRGLLETVIDVDGGCLAVYNTHLALTEEQRILQVRRLLELADRRPEPQVLLGDFNARPDSQPVALLADRYELASEDPGDPEPSFPAGTPDRRIDHVFVTPNIRVRRVTVLPTAASDHLPVESVIELAAPTDDSGG